MKGRIPVCQDREAESRRVHPTPTRLRESGWLATTPFEPATAANTMVGRGIEAG